MFYSILYPDRSGGEPVETVPPCFQDINLTQLFYPIFQEKKAYEPQPFYYSPVKNTATVKYRQDILRELEDETIRAQFSALSETVFALKEIMSEAKEQLASIVTTTFDTKPRTNYFARARFLRCVTDYCAEVSRLQGAIAGLTLKSAGLRGFAEYLTEHTQSPEFNETREQAEIVRGKLHNLEYNMLLRDKTSGPRTKTLRVRKYNGEASYSTEKLVALFARFKRGKEETRTYAGVTKLSGLSPSEDVANIVLHMVANAHKSIFDELYSFCIRNFSFIDETILRFAREVQFYIGWLEHIEPIRSAGLPFNYPEITEDNGDIFARGLFDCALAYRQRGEGIVVNDLELTSPERIVVVTGPNQGGKSTFARAVGQLHFLASLGLCVPGEASRLFLCDKILTHFGRQEDITLQSGQLQDDLLRLKTLLDDATPRSFIIINEILSSTTLEDALVIGGKMMEKLTALGVPAFVITFLDELADYGGNIVSFASVINADEPEKRTFKFTRKQPDSVAYAMNIAGKHGLTFEQLDRRLSECLN